jgi:hypothetical protein
MVEYERWEVRYRPATGMFVGEDLQYALCESPGIALVHYRELTENRDVDDVRIVKYIGATINVSALEYNLR